jgi:pyruvate/2-oxoglutarate dehydrogenase complex dihydrolipoamide acyltransferase (E2) component
MTPPTPQARLALNDHRSVDGTLGAQLIGAFKALIENPVMMLV